MLKRIISIILALLMLIPSAAFADETAASVMYEKEMQFLTSIGLVKSGSFEPDAPITRGEFANLIVKLYYSDISSDETYVSSFTDVPADSSYSHAVAFLENLKVVNGNSAHTFSPDSQILMKDAIVMLVRVLGYDLYANELGGYIAGYTDVANKIYLMNGVKWEKNEVDYQTALKLLYNSLFVSTIGMDYVSDKGIHIEVKHGKNFLSEKLDITLMDAVLINDGVRSYNNDGVLENYVTLKNLANGEEITVANTDATVSELFGYRVEAFVKIDKNTNKRELVCIRAHANNNITKIHSEDIVTSTTAYVEYKIGEEVKTKRINFDVENLYAFVNGYKIEGYSSYDFNPNYGEITYIDNSGDNKADVILIDNIQKQVIASAAPTDNKRILCKASVSNSIDLSSDDIVIRVYKDKNIVELADIAENDVISVAQAEKPFKDGKTMVTLYVSSKFYSGVLNETAENKLMVLDTNEYYLSKIYLTTRPNLFSVLKSTLTYTARLDSYGKIAYIDEISSDNIEYCYLLNVNQINAYDALKLYIFTRNSAFNELTVSDKVVIDGVNISKLPGNFKDNVVTALSKRYNPDSELEEVYSLSRADAAAYGKSYTSIVPRPAIIKVNTKGEIYYIDTDFPTYSDENTEAQDVYALRAGKRYYKNTMLRTHANNGNPGSIDGTFFITEDTLVFNVPDIDRYNMPTEQNTEYTNLYERDISDINNYKVLSYSDLHYADKYDIQVYNIDDATGIAAFAVIRGFTQYVASYNAASPDYETNYVFFKNLSKIADTSGNNDEMYKLYYMEGDIVDSVIINKTTLQPVFKNLIFGDEIKSESGKVLYPKADGLTRGDLITIEADKGTLVGVRRHIDFSKINEKAMTSLHPETPASLYTDQGGVVTYDVSTAVRAHFNDGSYVFQLAVPVSGNGSFFKIMQPLNSAGTEGTLSSYYSNGLGFYGTKESYVGVASAGFAAIYVLEEVKHSADGNCEIRVKSGTTSDIKYMDQYGFFDASRVYVNYISGDPQRMVIYNLLPEHNGKN